MKLGIILTSGSPREAGASWWIDSDWDGGTVNGLRRRIAAGPPRS